jgi:hypothetical protein
VDPRQEKPMKNARVLVPPPRKTFAATILALALTSASWAQSPKYTFHVNLDPNHGDDNLAFHLNPRNDPSTPAGFRPLADYDSAGQDFPDPALGPQNGSGALQHAPYSFRTLTGGASGQGALDYIQQVFLSAGPLPWQTTVATPNGSETREIHAIVIHCLPGLYGPDSTTTAGALSDIDPESGLRFNGEQFPIYLLPGISLQGTSALDTIFDARGADRDPPGSPEIIHLAFTGGEPLEYFVDSLTLRGARSDGQAYEPAAAGIARNNSGAAIYLGPDQQQVPFTVSNCFFVDNHVGIALDTDEPNARPRFVNNTFAFNAVAIWSGYRPGTGPNQQGNLGHARPMVLNNVFDTRSPDDPDHQQRTPFLGVHPDDTAVQTVFDATGTPVPGSDRTFNAWDTRQIDQPCALSSAIPNWHGTGVTPARRSGGSLSFQAPEVDLQSFLGSATVPRGLLYVCDALRLAGQPVSPHDFRLAPLVVADPRTISIGNPVSQLNPLVNRGVDLGHDLGRNSGIVMRSSTTSSPVQLTRYPGLDVPSFTSDDPDRFHGWDFDAEGFGNPRIRCRAGFADNGPFGLVDLGADELDELVMAGYVPSTRMFALPYWEGQGLPRTRIMFLDLRSGGAGHPRPDFVASIGKVFNWWEHKRWRNAAEGCPDCVSYLLPGGGTPTPTNYTDARRDHPFEPNPSLFTEREVVVTLLPSGQRPPIMRNLECDFGPSLLPDVLPLWGPAYFGASEPQMNSDIYGSNPWFGDCNRRINIHHANWNLYRNPTHPNPWHRGRVREGTLHPPGTYDNSSSGMFPPPLPPACGGAPDWFMPGWSSVLFGPFGSCGGSATYEVGTWGIGDSPSGTSICTDQAPLVDHWLGVRFNCQVSNPEQRSNLQTFLVVVGDYRPIDPVGTSVQRYPGPRLDPSAFESQTDPASALRSALQDRR